MWRRDKIRYQLQRGSRLPAMCTELAQVQAPPSKALPRIPSMCCIYGGSYFCAPHARTAEKCSINRQALPLSTELASLYDAISNGLLHLMLSGSQLHPCRALPSSRRPLSLVGTAKELSRAPLRCDAGRGLRSCSGESILSRRIQFSFERYRLAPVCFARPALRNFWGPWIKQAKAALCEAAAAIRHRVARAVLSYYQAHVHLESLTY